MPDYIWVEQSEPIRTHIYARARHAATDRRRIQTPAGSRVRGGPDFAATTEHNTRWPSCRLPLAQD